MITNTEEITKQVLAIQKGAFAGWYGAVSNFQDQAASAVDTMISQAGWVPEQGRQVISSWLNACKKERERYKTYMEESFSGLEKCLAQDTKATPSRPDKPAAQVKTAASEAETTAAAVEPEKAAAARETRDPIQ